MKDSNKLLASVFFVLAMSAVMLYTESKAGGESGIIVKLELASTVQKVEQLVNKYDEEHLQWLRLNTLLDFLFIITYTALFFFALKNLLKRFYPQKSSASVLSLAFIPGVLDVIENIFILNFLDRDFSTPYFSIYYWCVRAKWAMVTVFVLLSLVQLGLLIYKAAFLRLIGQKS